MACYGFKRKPTINIVIMCDADRNVVWMSPCYTGRTHDSTILKSTKMFEILNTEAPSCLRGSVIFV